MATIEHKNSFLGMLNGLSKIRQSILIENKGDKLLIENRNGLSTIQYHMEVPHSYFGIGQEELGIFNYPEFYKLVGSMPERSLEQTSDSIVIKNTAGSEGKVNSKNETIKYSLSDSTTVKAKLDTFNFGDGVVTFKFDSDEMKKINKMIGMTLLNSDVMQFSNFEDILILNTCNESGKSKNKWEERYTLESEPSNDYSIKFSSDAFKLIPEGSYNIRMNSSAIEFDLIHDEISLKLIIKKTS